MKIDSHQHFWKFDPVRDTWIGEDMKVLRADFLPDTLYPLLNLCGMDGTVAVQADQSEAETDFLINLADHYECIKGVVGWIDFRAANLSERLEHYSEFKKLKGFRHILQAEAKLDFMLDKKFCAGISKLKKFNFTYDILIFPKHLPFAYEFVKKFPDHKFVIDHIAKPDFKTSDFSFWEKEVKKLAELPNVYCKISGLVTEAHWSQWKNADFFPAMDIVTEAFGMDRLMFGSDWPVCLLAGSYTDIWSVTEQYFSVFTAKEKDNFYGDNATRFYGLE